MAEIIVEITSSGKTVPVKELVRCGKCMYYGNHDVCPIFSPKKDFYCAYGRRKDDV